MATRKKAAPKTFKAAYEVLKNNAEALQNTSEPDIDNLMTRVEESIAAYQVCQARIEAVELALSEAFTQSALIDEDETA